MWKSVYVNPDWDIHYDGRITENDMVNIMVRLGKNEINFDSKRDQRAYVSRNKDEAFERQLKETGYTLQETDLEKKTFMNEEGRTVTKSKWGLVKYHVPLSKEEVTRLVARREGKPEDEFTRAVADITRKSAIKESEAVK